MKNKRGFTLIELLTVIAILGILVLIAAPKFLGYTEKANIAKIQTGIKAVETAVDLKSLENPEFTADLVAITPDKLQEINDSGKLIDKNGFIKEDLEGGKNIPLKDLDVKWNSGGEFIINPKDDSVYYYNKDMNVSKNPDGSITTPGGNDGENNSEEPTQEPEVTVIPPETSESNFTWVNVSDGYTAIGQSQKGYYKYTGTGESTVVIPHIINSTPMTSYYRMFSQTGADVTKVVSTNANVTDMREMFAISKATTLDLSLFNTTNVTNMSYMFNSSKAPLLDLSSFDTSNVTTMNRMFQASEATSIIGLNKFNTFNVTDMGNMFAFSAAKSLDLSSFDTTNVTSMSSMFASSKATTLDLSKFKTSNVGAMNSMFYASEATSIIGLNKFNTTKITDMSFMFASSKATTLDLSSFDTSNVTNMSSMFRDSQTTLLDLSKLDTSKVADMNQMFRGSHAKTLDLSSFDTSKVTNMGQMFRESRVTEGYARTQTDANRLNASSYKPSTLTFITN